MEIRGKGLKFNQEAVELFFNNINYEDQTASSETYACFYGGMVAWARVNKAQRPTFEEVCDFVDTLTPEEIKQAFDAMGDTQKYKEMLQSIKDRIRQMVETKDGEGDKKKEAVKKSKHGTGSASTS